VEETARNKRRERERERDRGVLVRALLLRAPEKERSPFDVWHRYPAERKSNVGRQGSQLHRWTWREL